MRFPSDISKAPYEQVEKRHSPPETGKLVTLQGAYVGGNRVRDPEKGSVVWRL